jgi:hypothetical protein
MFLDTEMFRMLALMLALGILLGLMFGYLFWGWGNHRLRDEIDILTRERDNERHLQTCGGVFSTADCQHPAHKETADLRARHE